MPGYWNQNINESSAGVEVPTSDVDELLDGNHAQASPNMVHELGVIQLQSGSFNGGLLLGGRSR